LKDANVEENTYGTAGVAATQKEVKDYVAKEISKVNDSVASSTLKLASGTTTNTLNIKDETLEVASGTNTTVTLTKDANSKKATFKVDVKSNLTGITSIEKGINGTKITLNDDNITVNKKITGLEKGTGDTDAINKKQFDEELDKKLDSSKYETDKQTFVTNSEITKKLGDYADKKLSNITDEGKKVIKDLIKVSKADGNDNILEISGGNEKDGQAKEYKLSVKKTEVQKLVKDAVEVTSDTNSGITVTPDKTNNTKTTYKLSLKGDKIKELAGTTNIAKEYAKVNGSNITGLTDDNKKAWATGIGLSSISDTTKDQLVTDKAVKTYVDKKGLKFAGNTGDESEVSLGNKLSIVGEVDTTTTIGET
ncbi:hypothetical protein IMK14_06095, partial [Sneathia sp. DSM 16630]|nr:hypothetical protein [Sneathia sp. DSM 16630]